MSKYDETIFVEIPSSVMQSEVWEIEDKLKQVEGVTTKLQESKDVIAVTMLVLHITANIMGPVATIGAGIKSIHDVAKIIYEFLHSEDKEKASTEGKKKVIITKKGTRIEIYNLSLKEIEEVLKGR